ncbi:DUF1566 domain-containing protein [Planctobacterium marinum]|uniref:Lcl C-terminal domain-containing protein n=1 Tax=Planctobacterium marinum TaxID=1631968 RepID=A0AA48KP38_9ALTE|nr:hypothetical protein MACH26_17470 [Planctobacterium marinum]
MKLIKLVIPAFFAFACNIQAQTCVSGLPETAPEANFTDNEDGTVTDTSTGLMWMRCSIGQTWSDTDSTCTGDATALTWQEALQIAYGYEYAGHNDWRLPNVKQLISITEKTCVRPSINETIFPETTSDDYWSSTPSLNDYTMSWVVAFFNSSNSLKEKDAFVYSRLVRVAD